MPEPSFARPTVLLKLSSRQKTLENKENGVLKKAILGFTTTTDLFTVILGFEDRAS